MLSRSPLRFPGLGQLPASGLVAPAALALALVVLAIMALALGVGAWTGRARILADAADDAAAQARIMEEHAARTFGALDAVLVALALDAERAAARRRPEASPPVQRLVRRLRPPVQAALADAAGTVLIAYDAPDRPPGSSLPDAILDTHRHERRAGITVHAPERRGDGSWAVPVSRRIEDGQGRWTGIAVAEVAVADLMSFRDPPLPGRDRELALLRDDGVLLARHPPDPDAIGRSYAGTAFLAGRVAQGPPADGFETASAFDGRQLVAAYRRLRDLPLIVVAGVDRSAVLAQWLQEVALYTLGALIVGGVLLALVALLIRQAQRAHIGDARLRAAIDASMDAFFILRSERDAFGRIADFRFEDINPNGELAIGRPRDRIVGARLSEAAAPDDFVLLRGKYAAVVETGAAIEEELVVERPDGPEWLQHQIVRLGDGVAITSRNITERKRAEEKLIAAETRIFEITRTMPGAVIQFRRERRGGFRFTYASPSLTRLYGITPQALLANPRALMHPVEPGHARAVRRAVVRSARRGEPLKLDFRSRTPAGPRWFRIEAVPRPAGDDAIAWSAMLTDVTAEKHVEHELQLARQEAEAASRTKSGFLANMSHELRTPLNAIIGFSEGLASGVFGSLTPKQREYSEDIRAAGTHLLGIINDLLDLSKIEAGKAELYEQPVALAGAIDAAALLVRDDARARGLRLDTPSGEGLPTVLADETKLRQIFVNLLSNAVKFTPAGGLVSLTVRRQPGGALAITVRDSGIGIAAEDLPRVMEPFWQAEGAHTRSAGGTGLGLPLVKHLVEMHGGTLVLQSTLGSGTTVTVTLPAARVLPHPTRRPGRSLP